MPETASEHMKVTVAGVLIQPLEFGVGETLAEIAGAERSTFTVTDTLAEFPAESVTVPVTA